jgi:hypothetical protein
MTIWSTVINRIVPTGLLPRRLNTEIVLRGLNRRYRGKSLEAEFTEFGIGEAETKQIFDEIDQKFGAAIFCGDNERMDAAVKAAFALMAARTLGLKIS